MLDPVVFAFILTFIAGGSTTFGAILGIINKKPGPKYISFMMASAAGVMVYISFTEMLEEAHQGIGPFFSIVFLVVGIGIAGIIDYFLPEQENIHDHIYNNNKQQDKATMGQNDLVLDDKSLKGIPTQAPRLKQRLRHHLQGVGMQSCKDSTKMLKIGTFTALALFIHNLPEGLATFSASLISTTLGVQICVATAIHNIPEGISIAVPVYLASKSKKKAIAYATISGLAEPFGALIAFLVLSSFMNEFVLLCLLATVAGIMIYISVDTLIPTACTIYKHSSIAGFTFGMIVMAISLALLG